MRSSGGLYPVTIVLELVGIILGMVLSSRNRVSVIVVSREPPAGGEEWEVVYQEMTTSKKDASIKRACALLRDWEAFKRENLDK